MKSRIAVITSILAREIIEDVLRDYRDRVIVVPIPVHSIGMLKTSTIARILSLRKDLLKALKDADVILLPGTVEGDAAEVEKVVGVPTFKATKSPIYLRSVISFLEEGGELSKVEPAEEVMPRSRLSFESEIRVAFRIGKVSIPVRGPPMALASEIPPYKSSVEAARLAERMVGDGAELISVGCGFDEESSVLRDRIRAVAGVVEEILAETPSKDHVRAAIDSGALGVVAVPDVAIQSAHLLGKEHAIVVGDAAIDGLLKAERELKSLGITKIILDPTIKSPPLGFVDSVKRFTLLAEKSGSPLQFTAANVVEEIEADTHGMHALLAHIAAELRASVYYIVEDSYKSFRSTAEARESVDLAYTSWNLKRTKDLYSRLLVVKQPHPPPKARLGVKADRVGFVEPVMDRRGYITIYVDHERGVIVAVYNYYKGGKVAVEGRHATSIARELIRRTGIDPEHSAYLGYELAKAEIALNLGKSYIQDEPVIVPVWGIRRGSEGEG